MAGRVTSLILVALLALAGCASQPREELVVFAAASLRDVLTELASAYARQHPAVHVRLSFDASSLLRVQIEQGAPADLFLSADDIQPRRLADAGLTAAHPIVFAHNRLALVVPVGNPGRIRDWTDLGRPGLTLVASGPDVPITAYADEVTKRLALLPKAPPGFAASVAANVASREDNVRAVLARVELGEADAAFVYASDAHGDTKVTTLPLPDEAQVLADYAGVALPGPQTAAASALLDWLTGVEAQRVFAAAGFSALHP
jgi:molybdate transport system substrate-binding protein